MSPDRKLLAFAGFNGAMAVALGAFAAHGAAPAVKTLLTTGGLLSLPVMGAVAPVGGALMIAGWALLIFAAFQSNPPKA
ncbi:MAG: hypothetical protein HYU61_00040 [Brevundimonas diminuta]|nr:hypothetical protein [Brevundimonas diminuta]